MVQVKGMTFINVTYEGKQMRRVYLILPFLTIVCGQLSVSGAEVSNTVIFICNHANKLMAQKKEKDAVSLLEQVFKRNPNYALAKSNLAIAYINRALACANPDEAIFNVHRALALNPEDATAQKDLEYVLQKGKVDVSTVDGRIKYAEALGAQGDDVGAYVEYQLALKAKDDPAVQKQADALISPDDKNMENTVGGPGAALVLRKIEIDHSKDGAFNFEYFPYVRSVERKVRTCWKAPASLGNRKVEVAFDTNSGGAVSDLKVAASCGNKEIDTQALNAVKSASPFRPLASEIFFDIPMTITLDAHPDESPTYYLNGEAKPDGLRFRTGAELHPLRAPKNVDDRLQAKTDAALAQASKADQETAQLERQFGGDSIKLCAKLCSAASLYVQATEYKLAEDRLERAVTIAQKAKADDQQAIALSQLGSLYYTNNRNADAEAKLKEAINLLENTQTKDTNTLRSTLEAYAKVLYRLNRVNEANQIYDKIKGMANAAH